jgi:hypothetical protein
MNKLCCLIIMFITCGVCFSQVAPQIQWTKCLGGNYIEQSYSIKQTLDSGFIAVGNTHSNDGDVTGFHGYSDSWVVKLKPSGEIQWQKALGGSNLDDGMDIQLTRDGGYIVAGITYSDNGDVSGLHGGSDCWIVKLDSLGNIQWQKPLGGAGYEAAFSIKETSDGGYICAAVSDSANGDVTENHGKYDCWIIKLDILGNIQWQKSMGGSNDDWAVSIIQTNDGGYAIAGYTSSNDGDILYNHGSEDYWIIKLDSMSNVQWQKTFGGSGYDAAQSIIQTQDGTYIIAGSAGSNDGDVTLNHGMSDYWVIKLNEYGNLIWEKTFGGTDQEQIWGSICQTSDGNYVVVGLSDGADGDVTYNHGGYDYWIVKFNPSGKILWQESLGGSMSDYPTEIKQTIDSGYIISGFTWSNNGDVSGNHGNWDYWIVKLLPDTVKSVPDTLDTDTVNYFQLFPNPVTNQLTVKTNDNEQSEIILYDIASRKILQQKFTNSVSLNTEQLAKGIYLYEVRNKNGVIKKGKVVKD